MTTEPAALLALALDPSVAKSEDPSAERILDAALEEAAASGVRRMTMDDVARRARLGRMTVYRRFGSKDRLVEALAVRECRRCLAELAAAVDPLPTVEERMVEGFVVSLRIARQHPLLDRLVRREPDQFLGALGADDGLVLGLARAFLAARIREEGASAGMDADEVAETVIRLVLSFVLIPQSAVDVADEAAAREFARAFVAPIVTRAI